MAGAGRRTAALIVGRILEQCGDHPTTSYCVPFVATGSVCLALLAVRKTKLALTNSQSLGTRLQKLWSS
jgi:hypothetical protein